MTIILDGTNGLSDVDGSASTPAIRGTDANTGIFFPAADTIAFAEGGTEVMRIDSSGRVTKPFQPGFRAYATSSQSPAPGAVIIFNNDSASGMFNTGSYNTSNGRFTAPVTGIYAFTASVLYQSCPNGQYGDTSIYGNGTTLINYNRRQYQSTYTGYGGYFEAQISAIVKLTASDYVTINNGSASTQSLYVNDASWTWFSGYLLG